jgi:ATP-dependent Clp protease ATP-binding subunit ClpX
LGARGLRSICEAILNEAMYEIPGSKNPAKEYRVTLEYAQKQFSSSKMAKMKAA